MSASNEVDLEHVRIVRVQPGDVVTLTTDGPLDPQAVERVRVKLSALFPDNECIVISGAELSVARPE
jgi:hypothetical protein